MPTNILVTAPLFQKALPYERPDMVLPSITPVKCVELSASNTPVGSVAAGKYFLLLGEDGKIMGVDSETLNQLIANTQELANRVKFLEQALAQSIAIGENLRKTTICALVTTVVSVTVCIGVLVRR